MIWVAIVLLAILFSLMLIGEWLAFAMGVTGIIVSHIWGSGMVSLVGGTMWSALYIYGLTAIPAFIFMGEIIMHSGLATRAFNALSPLASRLPGKLIQINVIMSAVFAAIFGSSTACAAAVGNLSIPELRKRGYKDSLVLGSIAVAGTLAFMIPPSGHFILYGSVVGESIAALFAAGIVPGFILIGLFMVSIAIQTKLDPTLAPKTEQTLPWGKTIKTLFGLWPIAIIMILCIGPIYAGISTATEAAGLGACASMIVGFTVGDLTWKSVWESLEGTCKIVCKIQFLVIGAMILSTAISQIGMPRQLINWISTLDVSPLVIMGVIIVMYIAMGTVLDGIAMMLMTLPFVYPIVTMLGYDGIWFGVFMCLVAEVGLITPPLGINLFIVQAVASQTGPTPPIGVVIRGATSLLICSILVWILITIFPKVVTWLPNLMYQ